MKPVLFEDLLAKLDRLIAYRRLLMENQALRRQLHAAGRPGCPGRREPADAGGQDDDPQGRPDAEHRADHRRVGHRQGAGRPRPARRRGPTRRACSWPSTARPSRTTCSRTSSSATSGAPSPAPTATTPGCSSRPAPAPSSSTRSASYRRSTQAKLLRAIENKEVLPVGATRPVKFQARLITATNKDLTAEVAARSLPRRPVLSPQRRHDPPAPAPRPPRRHPRPGVGACWPSTPAAWASGSTASTTRRSAA